jgi:aspartate/methionine/tyrosine aminotransferase
VFSRRLPESLSPNALARARERVRVEHDLTVSNPTLCGFPYPADLLAPLASSDGLVYRPDPQGMASAREALGARLAVSPDRIVLAASTSEAYALLFKLLADPGDTVAFPAPSYPLIEHLARLEGLSPVPYRLDPDDAWRPDRGSLPAGARVLVAVSPNNPTGSYLDGEALQALSGAAPALVVDEVFRAFPLEAPTGPTSVGFEDTLTFTLGGLSKELGLPQLKLAWIVVSGEEAAVTAAVERLGYLADQYLSVATPVQHALPTLLGRAAPVREAIAARCGINLRALRDLAQEVPEVSVPPVEGGWTALLRMPAVIGEEALALRLLEERGVAVQPGYFFDFPREGILVLSLLPPPASFHEGIRRVLHEVKALARC